MDLDFCQYLYHPCHLLWFLLSSLGLTIVLFNTFQYKMARPKCDIPIVLQ
jgi:hypothetical protein